MKLLVGLGNPGNQYLFTRHNAGFTVIDAFVRTLGEEPPQKKKFNSFASQITIANQSTWVVKPQTYMNASGEAVHQFMQFYKLTAADLLVVHDELDLEPGRIQLKQGGGDAGHQGVSSILEKVGDDDFLRLRIGIGRPEGVVDTSNYVLGRFSLGEMEPLKEAVGAAVDALYLVAEKGVVAAMNVVNRRE